MEAKKKKEIIKYLRRTLLVILLLLVFTVANFFVVRGTYELRYYGETAVSVSMDRDDIVEVEYGYYSPGSQYYRIGLNALNPGAVNITAHFEDSENEDMVTEIRVHPTMIIYENDYVGSVGNMLIVRYEIAFLFLIATVNLIISLRKHMRINMYSYRIMYYVGALVYSAVNFLSWTLGCITPGPWKDRLYTVYSGLVDISAGLPVLFFPVVVGFSVLLSVSNIVLLKKEGFRIRNMLGIGLGLFLIVMTVIPFFMYPLFDGFTKLHSYLGMHLESFFEIVFFTILCYFECMFIGTLVGTIKAQRFVPKFEQDYMIILGSGLRADGTVTPLLKNRADRAVWFAEKQKEQTGKDLIYVASGGQGEDELIPEAQAIKNYLLSIGIPKERILTEEKSRSTYENMKFSKEIITAHAKKNSGKPEGEFSLNDIHIAFSTTDYHVFRSGRIAYKLGMNAYGVGARTKWYFYLNAQIREFAANMNVQQKRHIMNIVYLILMVAFLLVMSYRFQIM